MTGNLEEAHLLCHRCEIRGCMPVRTNHPKPGRHGMGEEYKGLP
jgi:hypothetical protein